MSYRVHHAILELSFNGAINLSPCPGTLSSKRARCSEGGTRAGLATYAFNGGHTNWPYLRRVVCPEYLSPLTIPYDSPE